MHEHFEYFLKLGQTDPITISLISIIRKGESIDHAFQKQYDRELSIAKDWINMPDSFKTRIGNPTLQVSFENAKGKRFSWAKNSTNKILAD